MKIKLNDPIDYTPYLDKVQVNFIRIPKRETSKWRDLLLPFMIKIKSVNPINNTEKDFNKIYLNPDLTQPELEKLSPSNCPTIQSESIQLSFENCDYKELLRKMLPVGYVVPTSFESLGTIAFLNLRNNQTDFQYTIGKVVLDTHAIFRTVVNKTEKLNNQFRTPVLELIAGIKQYETEIKEENTKFLLNVEEVYFCSRLHHERSRIISQLKSGEVIVDVFCGIGPFSIRAANEAGCFCYANDLNPECFKYLKINIKKNKVEKKVFAFCMDGRQFMRDCFSKITAKEIKRVDHLYMNLPAIGIEFLDVFNEKEFQKWDFTDFKIHTTCFEEFEKEESGTIEKVKERIQKIMKEVVHFIEFLNFHFIKNVSNKKAMICVTLLVKTGVLLEPQVGSKHDSIENSKNSNSVGLKKIKLE